MKRFCVLLILIALLSCHSTNYKAARYCVSGFMATKDKAWISFDLVKELYQDGKLTARLPYHIGIHNDGEHSYLVVTDSLRMNAAMITDSLLVIDNINRELACYHQSDTCYFYNSLCWDFGKDIYEYLPYYLMNWPRDIRNDLIPKIEEIIDTVVGGAAYKEYVFYTSSYEYNEETGQFDIPWNYRCNTWVNAETLDIDSVVVFNVTHNKYSSLVRYSISSISTEDKSRHYDTVFNFDNLQYRNYSRHTESFPQYSRIGSIKESNSLFLTHPVIDLNGSTVTLNDTDDFILLNFWGFDCKPCIKNLQRYKRQIDSLGYRIIEKNGIRIMAINYLSDNMDMIAKIAEETNTGDIMYSSKGMRLYIKIPYVGYYYLLSPDKKIIYETDYLGDYSELFKAKETWEKQHPKYKSE